jgi:hypothetical protein
MPMYQEHLLTCSDDSKYVLQRVKQLPSNLPQFSLFRAQRRPPLDDEDDEDDADDADDADDDA